MKESLNTLKQTCLAPVRLADARWITRRSNTNTSCKPVFEGSPIYVAWAAPESTGKRDKTFLKGKTYFTVAFEEWFTCGMNERTKRWPNTTSLLQPLLAVSPSLGKTRSEENLVDAHKKISKWKTENRNFGVDRFTRNDKRVWLQLSRADSAECMDVAWIKFWSKSFSWIKLGEGSKTNRGKSRTENFLSDGFLLWQLVTKSKWNKLVSVIGFGEFLIKRMFPHVNLGDYFFMFFFRWLLGEICVTKTAWSQSTLYFPTFVHQKLFKSLLNHRCDLSNVNTAKQSARNNFPFIDFHIFNYLMFSTFQDTSRGFGTEKRLAKKEV